MGARFPLQTKNYPCSGEPVNFALTYLHRIKLSFGLPEKTPDGPYALGFGISTA